MINRFKNYNDLRNYTNNISDTAMKSVEYINKLKLLVEKGSFTEEYYEKQNKKLKLLGEELSACLILQKDILNSKTNEIIIKIILNMLNKNEIKYKLRIIQISGYDNVYELDKEFYEIYPTSEEQVLFSIFLVRNDILNSNLAEKIHNKQEYDNLTKNGLLIDLNSRLLSINNEDIKSYLEDKTIDIDNIVGLKEEIKEQIHEKLFNDYKNEYNKNEAKAKVKKY